MGCSEYQFLCDKMAFFWCEIADIRQEGREDQYLANQCLDKLEQSFDRQEKMLQAILE
jgi:hypothetical protein